MERNPSNAFLNRLAGGDRRSIGQSNLVAALVLRKPAMFRHLMDGLQSADVLIRMRAADAAEKVSLRKPELLQPFKASLLRLLDIATEQELRWHLAQMVPRLRLSKKDRMRAANALRRHLTDTSSIVKTSAMQAMVDLARIHPDLMPEAREVLTTFTRSGTPAMKARGRRLLAQTEQIVHPLQGSPSVPAEKRIRKLLLDRHCHPISHRKNRRK